MSTEKKDSNPGNYYVFMVILGLIGVFISWGILGPRYILLLPGLSEITAGKVIDRRQLPAMDGQYEYTVTVVEFRDGNKQLHSFRWNGKIWGDVIVRYSPLKPDFAIVEEGWPNELSMLGQLSCLDLPSLALVVTGILMYRKLGHKAKDTAAIASVNSVRR
jgi:hypothetical protein